jgi:hypothetical protein
LDIVKMVLPPFSRWDSISLWLAKTTIIVCINLKSISQKEQLKKRDLIIEVWR